MRRLLGLLVAAVLSAGVLTGCGSDAQSDVAEVVATAAFLSEAAERTTEDATGRFEGTFHLESTVPEEQAALLRDPQYNYQFDTVGVYDAEAGLVSYESTTRYRGLNFPQEGLEGSGEGVESGSEAFLRGFPYSGPDSLFGLDEGEWVSVQVPEELLETLGAGAESGTASPSDQLELLKERLEAVEEVGSEEVRGVATTHLVAVFPFSDDALELMEEQGLGDDPRLEVDVWVDDGGRVRRLENQFTADRVTSISSTEYFDFGIEVEITEPEDATPLEDLPAPRPPEQAPPSTAPSGLTDEEIFDACHGVDECEDLLEMDVSQEEIDAAGDLSGFPPLPGLSPEGEALWNELRAMTPTEINETDCGAYEDPELLEVCHFWVGVRPGE